LLNVGPKSAGDEPQEARQSYLLWRKSSMGWQMISIGKRIAYLSHFLPNG
jgi:hypothetical protein